MKYCASLWAVIAAYMLPGLVAISFVVFCSSAKAQAIYTDKDGNFAPQTLSVPYAFYNDDLGVSGGWVYGVSGGPQDQSTVLITGMIGSEGAGILSLLGSDLLVPNTERWFVDPVFTVSLLSNTDVYTNGNPNYPNQRSGSNDSSPENFVSGEGKEIYLTARFKYLLPIGEGRDEIIETIKIDNGFPVDLSKAEPNSLNFTEHGRTYLEVVPFYRNLSLDNDEDFRNLKTNGLEFNIKWDNRDFKANPTEGHSITTKSAFDFGLFDSTNSWNSLSVEVDQYASFGSSKYLRQNTLAFDFWTAYSPSWDDNNGVISNRPPAYAGPNLGGLWRMRAYPSQRFSDQSAIYYSAEWRLTPKWNPFDNYPKLQEYIGVEWLQFVPFIEVGRVAPSYDLGELHSDMKVSGGFGIRAWAKGIVVRADIATSDESTSVQMMVSQPFQF
jgi:Omp85 superfamily domain